MTWLEGGGGGRWAGFWMPSFTWLAPAWNKCNATWKNFSSFIAIIYLARKIRDLDKSVFNSSEVAKPLGFNKTWVSYIRCTSKLLPESTIVHRGPGILAAVVWFGSSPTPSRCPSVSHRKTEKERQLDGRGGGGAKSYDGEKAWFSISHSILWKLSSTEIVIQRYRVMH